MAADTKPAFRESGDTAYEYDFVIVGSGFGGSVSALRLAEKGYKVLVLEAGKRWRTQDFPKSNWNVRKFLWMPALFCHGIQRYQITACGSQIDRPQFIGRLLKQWPNLKDYRILIR